MENALGLSAGFRAGVARTAAALLLACFVSAAPVNGKITYALNQPWDASTGWTLAGTGTKEINPAGQLHLATTGSGTTDASSSGTAIGFSYTAEFRLKVAAFGTEVGTAIYDGTRRVRIYFTSAGVSIRDSSGAAISMFTWSADTAWHVYRLENVNGVVNLFKDGVAGASSNVTVESNTSADSFQHWVKGTTAAEIYVDYSRIYSSSVPVLLNEGFTSTSGWTAGSGGTQSISPAGQLFLQSSAGSIFTTSKTLALPKRYLVEFKYKVDTFGANQGVAFYDGTHRLMLYFRSTGLELKRWDGVSEQVVSWSSDTAWHTYKIKVDKGYAQVFFDGTLVNTYDMNKNASAGKIDFFVGNGSAASAHVDYVTVWDLTDEPSGLFTFNDDFESTAAGGDPAAWMETDQAGSHSYNQNAWTAYSDAGNKVLRGNSTGDTAAMLHVLARDFNFAGRFKVNASSTNTRLYFYTRRNDETAYLTVYYNFSDQKWRIIQSVSEDDTQATLAVSPAAEPLAAGWHAFAIMALDGYIGLYLDGSETPILKATNTKPGLGRLGFGVKAGDVFFDDVAYTGDARVNLGIRELGGFTHNNSTDMVKLPNGKYLMTATEGGVSGVWESSNSGDTWTFLTKGAGTYEHFTWHSVVLADGTLLSVDSIAVTGGTNYVSWRSTDNGATWLDEDAGTSGTQPGTINASPVIGSTMPGKLMQGTNGRIFFASGETDPNNLNAGGVQIYYSDSGSTWTKAATTHDWATFGINLQEGAVLQTGTNTLKAFFRTDLLFLYSSVSTDNGVHWSTPVPTTLPAPRCAFGVRTDPATGYQYVAWENTDNDDYSTSSPHIQYPRNRVTLARSTDNTATWKTVTDIDDFMIGTGKESRHMNHSLCIFDNTAWIVTARCANNSETNYTMKIWNVRLNTVTPYTRLLGLHDLDSFK